MNRRDPGQREAELAVTLTGGSEPKCVQLSRRRETGIRGRGIPELYVCWRIIRYYQFERFLLPHTPREFMAKNKRKHQLNPYILLLSNIPVRDIFFCYNIENGIHQAT